MSINGISAEHFAGEEIEVVRDRYLLDGIDPGISRQRDARDLVLQIIIEHYDSPSINNTSIQVIGAVHTRAVIVVHTSSARTVIQSDPNIYAPTGHIAVYRYLKQSICELCSAVGHTASDGLCTACRCYKCGGPHSPQGCRNAYRCPLCVESRHWRFTKHSARNAFCGVAMDIAIEQNIQAAVDANQLNANQLNSTAAGGGSLNVNELASAAAINAAIDAEKNGDGDRQNASSAAKVNYCEGNGDARTVNVSNKERAEAHESDAEEKEDDGGEVLDEEPYSNSEDDSDMEL